MTPVPDSQTLSQLHAQARRRFNLIWLGIVVTLIIFGVLAALVLGDLQYVGWGLFGAIFAVIGLIYNHFVLFRRGLPPEELQAELEQRWIANQRNAQMAARVNGGLLVLASPLFFLVGVSAGAELGGSGAVMGAIAGSVGLGTGLLLIVRSRRTRESKPYDQ
jgi:Na+/melibiose symporter-like transporter